MAGIKSIWVLLTVVGGLMILPVLVLIVAAAAGWRSVFDALVGLPWPVVFVIQISGLAGWIPLIYGLTIQSQDRRRVAVARTR